MEVRRNTEAEFAQLRSLHNGTPYRIQFYGDVFVRGQLDLFTNTYHAMNIEAGFYVLHAGDLEVIPVKGYFQETYE